MRQAGGDAAIRHARPRSGIVGRWRGGIVTTSAMKELRAIVDALAQEPFRPAVLASLVSVEGSSYRRPGARLLVRAGGDVIGSISGGCLEEDVLARAEHVARTGRAELVTYDTTSENDLVWGVGLGCHGVARVLLEPLPQKPAWVAVAQRAITQRHACTLATTYESAPPGVQLGTAIVDATSAAGGGCSVFVQVLLPPLRLAIFGAGEDARPLSRMASELGWDVVVADPRPAHATPARFPLAREIHVGPADTLVARCRIDERTVAVVMTHHYVHDVPVLRAALASPAPYIGLLGPRKRGERILSDLAASGCPTTAEQRARLHAPVGLDLGADGAEQVSLSILAEIQAVLAGRDAAPLRERALPIHTEVAGAGAREKAVS